MEKPRTRVGDFRVSGMPFTSGIVAHYSVIHAHVNVAAMLQVEHLSTALLGGSWTGIRISNWVAVSRPTNP